MIETLFLLAQSDPVGPPAPGEGVAPAGPDMSFFFALMLAIVVFYVFLFRGQRRERQKHDEMLKNVKKNDRVQTIGGILGTVVETRENEIVLKVDESNNVKIRFNRGAIKEVVQSSGKDGEKK